MERLKKDKKKKGGSAIATLGGSRTGTSGGAAVEISAPTSVKQGKEEEKNLKSRVNRLRRETNWLQHNTRQSTACESEVSVGESRPCRRLHTVAEGIVFLSGSG